MKYKKLYKILLVVFVAAMLLYIALGVKRKKGVDYQLENRADGEGMTFQSFNDVSTKAVVLKSRTSRKGEKDRVYMTQIEALIYKKGRMSKDIRVFADQGYTENDGFNFFIEKNARLVSEDFTIRSDNFFMKDRAEMSSAPRVEYYTKAINGIATGGMGLYLNVNTLKFYNTHGTYKRGDLGFDYETQVLWFIDKDKIMVLEKDAVVRNDKSLLRSDWVTMKFSQDMKQVIETSSQKNSYFYFEDKSKQEIKEIKSDNIQCLNDAEGRLTMMSVLSRGEILLKNPNNQTSIASDVVHMKFDGPTGRAQHVNIPKRGLVENTGKTRFRVLADVIDMDYDNGGELRSCVGTGNVVFVVETYDGTTGKITYDIKKHAMRLLGENSQLVNKTNSFYSVEFNVDTAKKILSSDKGVKSVIRLEKDNVLFSKEVIFINAQKVEILEKENKFSYDRNVNLTQGEVKLTAAKLEISEINDITATGKVSLFFKSEGKEVALKGETLKFDSKTKTIDIRDQAVIKSGENVLQATHIIISFNKTNEVQSILGRQKVNFQKEDLSGNSDRVEWDFKKDIMVFKGSPRISRTRGGQTTGEVLKIDLNSSRITILSNESNRSETVIQ